MRTIKLNGSPIGKKLVQGLDDIEYIISSDDDNLLQDIKTSSELIFSGSGYQVIRQALIDPINSQFNFVTVEVWDDCCNNTQKFLITDQDISFCDDENCTVKVRLREQSPDAELLRKLRSKKINDANLFNNPGLIPKFNFCVTHSHAWITHMLMAAGLTIGVLYNVLIAPLYGLIVTMFSILINICIFLIGLLAFVWFVVQAINILIGFINFVINAWNQIPILPNLPTINLSINPPQIIPPFCQTLINNPFNVPFLGDLLDLLKAINIFRINCDDKHPAPLIRYYLDNIVQVSGASSWISSYFGNPAKDHYNMALLFAPVNNGDPNPPTIYGQNLPAWTCAEALDNFCKIINGRWFVWNLQIYVERKDYIRNNFQLYFDAVQNKANVISGACYEPGIEVPYASAIFTFTQDPREECGNEILDEYKAEVDYEQLHGQNPKWENRNQVTIPYSGVRVRNDGLRPIIKYDPLTWWQNLVFPNVLMGGALQATNKYLMLNKGTTTVPKVLVWDVNSGTNDAKVKEYGNANFNDALKFKPGIGGLFWPVNNGSMYDDCAIDDPSINPYYRYNFSIEIKFNCVLFANAIPGQQIQLSQGLGCIKQYIVKPDKSISITGKV